MTSDAFVHAKADHHEAAHVPARPLSAYPPVLSDAAVNAYRTLEDMRVLASLRQQKTPHHREMLVVEGRPHAGWTTHDRRVGLIPELNSSGLPIGSYHVVVPNRDRTGEWIRLPPHLTASQGSLHLQDPTSTLAIDLHARSFNMPQVMLSQAPHAHPRTATLPSGTALQWHDGMESRASGAFASGWKSELMASSGAESVFVKALKHDEAAQRLVKGQRALAESVRYNPAASQYISTSHYLGQAPTVAQVAGQPAAAIAVDEHIQGPTLDAWGKSLARHGQVYLGELRVDQLASIGCMAATGLRSLNRNSPVGARVVFPDACKPDNVMIPAVAIDPTDRWLPHHVVFIDKDSAISERNLATSTILGHPFYCDINTIYEMGQRRNLDQVDQVHAFQVGRMMLGALLGGDLPPTAADRPRHDISTTDVAASTSTAPQVGMDDESEQERNIRRFTEMRTMGYMERCFAQVREQRHATTGDGHEELFAIIRQCCHEDVAKRPSLSAVAHYCERITTGQPR